LSYCKNLSISGFTIPICVLLFYQSDKSEFADIVSVYELTIESVERERRRERKAIARRIYTDACKTFDLFCLCNRLLISF